MKMQMQKPFLPVNVLESDTEHTVSVLGREYCFSQNGMPNSVKSQGKELLNGPVRVVMRESNSDSVWDTDYAQNESSCFIHSRDDEKAILCG